MVTRKQVNEWFYIVDINTQDRWYIFNVNKSGNSSDKGWYASKNEGKAYVDERFPAGLVEYTTLEEVWQYINGEQNQ